MPKPVGFTDIASAMTYMFGKYLGYESQKPMRYLIWVDILVKFRSPLDRLWIKQEVFSKMLMKRNRLNVIH